VRLITSATSKLESRRWVPALADLIFTSPNPAAGSDETTHTREPRVIRLFSILDRRHTAPAGDKVFLSPIRHLRSR
jgi:hypothetical protein